MPQRPTLYMVSLGCPKNRVDSEIMLGAANRAGYELVGDPARARVIVVNTCGFIESAKRESIDAIFEMAAHKQEGACERLVVTGCLAQRHHAELAAEIPEIDHLLGSGDLMRLQEVLAGKAARDLVGSAAGYLVRATDRRVISTGQASAYVKIAEGCDRRCSFCVIPDLRGKHRSRPVADIVREVEQLAAQGVFEVNLVSQDTIAYGHDLGARKASLAELVEKVANVSGIRWVRLLYLYPDELDDRLLELLAGHESVLPYIDMPMQHASDSVLKRMRRGHSKARLRKTIERLRKRVPDLTLRTAFIVGFPGETESDFAELIDFVQWARFDRLGVFRFSDEDTAPSYGLEDKVPARESYNRWRRLMAAQRPIAKAANHALVGRDVQVLVEGASEEHELVMVGRHAGQAPDIDGQVWFTNSEVSAGELWKATVVRATDYDLVVETVGKALHKPARGKARRGLPVIGSRV
ncbi:MAG: 30S ribosomal protein S12 methylthiotransferase RimO [Deltaproteobacteria bacterium]|nr:30S ribosomal protein S12 methylthiotransferase RimO [Deltaproteobacteria bacterium]